MVFSQILALNDKTGREDFCTKNIRRAMADPSVDLIDPDVSASTICGSLCVLLAAFGIFSVAPSV